MFSGIVEAQSKILKTIPLKSSLRLQISRPKSFSDLQIGDSVSTNGMCLTVEALTAKSIQFCLGAETLSILGSRFELWQKHPLNLERSLQFGARVHGHLVTGHVDAAAKIVKTFQQGECWQIQIEVPKDIAPYFWKKGSVCLNGVSLTVNEFFKKSNKYYLEVCLIPETIAATNLISFKEKEFFNIEADYLAKAYIESRAHHLKDFA